VVSSESDFWEICDKITQPVLDGCAQKLFDHRAEDLCKLKSRWHESQTTGISGQWLVVSCSVVTGVDFGLGPFALGFVGVVSWNVHFNTIHKITRNDTNKTKQPKTKDPRPTIKDQ
jgi:hypothetical protein